MSLTSLPGGSSASARWPGPEVSGLRRSVVCEGQWSAVNDDLRENQQESSAEPGFGVGSTVEDRPSTDLVDGANEENRGGQKHKQPKSRQELRVLR
ncbi:hypothetical protein ACFXTH_000917 [Malus domestica]